MFCGTQNSAIEIVADTDSPVIEDIRISFRSALKIFPVIIEKIFTQLHLIFLL